MGASQVGVFAIGLELGSLPTTELVEPLGRALFSGFASLHNTSGGLGNMFLGAVGLGLMLILPAGVGISMVAEPMIRLSLGDPWVVAVPVVQIMAIGGTTAIISSSCSNLLNAIGRPNVTFYISFVGVTTKVVALLIMVPRLGLSGAAVAILLASGAELILLLAVTLPPIGVSLTRLVACLIRPAIATAAMVLVLWQFGMAWTPSLATTTIDLARDTAVRCSLGATCYCLVLVFVWVAAGRPDGAEHYTLKLATNLWGRIRRFA